MANVEDLGLAPNVDVELLIGSSVLGKEHISGAPSNSPERDIHCMLHGTQFTLCPDVDIVVFRVLSILPVIETQRYPTNPFSLALKSRLRRYMISTGPHSTSGTHFRFVYWLSELKRLPSQRHAQTLATRSFLRALMVEQKSQVMAPLMTAGLLFR